MGRDFTDKTRPENGYGLPGGEVPPKVSLYPFPGISLTRNKLILFV